MKKALVLGVLAFFAINIASVQSVNAQEKKATPAKTVKQSKTTATSAAKANTATTTEVGKEKVVKPAAASWDTEKKDAKACCKEEGKKDCNKEVPTTKKVDPTAKNKKTPEIGVPPTQNKAKKTTTSGTANGTTGTTK